VFEVPALDHGFSPKNSNLIRKLNLLSFRGFLFTYYPCDDNCELDTLEREMIDEDRETYKSQANLYINKGRKYGNSF
jgi:hypothetical protein